MMAVRTSTAMIERVNTSSVPPASMALACIPLARPNAPAESWTYVEQWVYLALLRGSSADMHLAMLMYLLLIFDLSQGSRQRDLVSSLR